MRKGLANKFAELSDGVWPESLKEWILSNEIRLEDGEAPEKCVCGQPITYVSFAEHKTNGNKFPIGSECRKYLFGEHADAFITRTRKKINEQSN